MRKLYLVIFVAPVLFFLFQASGFAIEFPKPQGFVNDYINALSASQRTELEQELRAFEQQTSNEIVIAIVPNFEGLDRFTYSQKLFTAWEIGKKEKNNGMLFIIAPIEGLPFPQKGEAFVNVGKGLEGALPDSLVGSILRREVYPHFRNGLAFVGIKNGIEAFIAATKGEYAAGIDKRQSREFPITILFWIGFIFLSYLGSFLGRTKSWWLGGVLGAAGGLAIGFIFWTGAMIFIAAGVTSVLGFLFDFIVSKNYAYRKAHGKPTDFWHSGGGFWFGGGGGFGGSGFGGFGGGISGGGGAGGRW